MIFNGIITVLFSIIIFFIDSLPGFEGLEAVHSFIALLKPIGYFISFLGADLFFAYVSHFTVLKIAHLTWSIIEWCYKKIPGVD